MGQAAFIRPEKRLTAKELAFALGRRREYVWWMQQAGFVMPKEGVTLKEAHAWLVRNPPPRARQPFQATV